MNKKQLVFRVIVPIFSVIVLLIVLELFTNFYLTAFGLPRRHFEFRKQQPAPYKHAPYFSKDFISEAFRQPQGWQYPKGTRLIIPNDYKGRYFNVADGRRATAFQPEKYESAVYVFGGSTTYSGEVPDTLTVPSQLQLIFNRHYGDKYIVHNYGTTTVTITQQVERLKTVSLKPGDFVVFYDGVNEIYQGIFFADPDEVMFLRDRRIMKKMSFMERFLLTTHRRFSAMSALVRVFLDPIDRSTPTHLSDINLMDQLFLSMISRYKKAIIDAHDYSSKSSATFIHFLQPHLYADDNFSGYEKHLKQNFFIVPRGMEESFRRGYPVLEKAISELPKSIHSYDLTDILNNRPDNVEFFLDSSHVTHQANRIIAENIFNSLNKIISSTN